MTDRVDAAEADRDATLMTPARGRELARIIGKVTKVSAKTLRDPRDARQEEVDRAELKTGLNVFVDARGDSIDDLEMLECASCRRRRRRSRLTRQNLVDRRSTA
jgi:hypothetical protein